MTTQTWRIPADGPAVMLRCAAPDCDEWDGLAWSQHEPGELDGRGADYCLPCRQHMAFTSGPTFGVCSNCGEVAQMAGSGLCDDCLVARHEDEDDVRRGLWPPD